MQIPDWLRARIRDNENTLKLDTSNDVKGKFTERDILEDFSVKMVKMECTGYQDYYEKAQEHGVAFSSRIAKCKGYLKAIE